MTATTLDDFQEFFNGSYRTIVQLLEANGLEVSIEAGTTGHYLLVARPADGLASTRLGAVEVTADDKPLPANPQDVKVWVVTTSNGRVMVPNESDSSLPDAVATLLMG